MKSGNIVVLLLFMGSMFCTVMAGRFVLSMAMEPSVSALIGSVVFGIEAFLSAYLLIRVNRP